MTKTQKTHLKTLVKALESGEYAQISHCLCKIGEKYDYFCAMGVACNIYQLETGKLAVTEDSLKEYLRYNGSVLYAPSSVLHYFGFLEEQKTSLMRKNDIGASFDEIAKHLKDKILNAK